MARPPSYRAPVSRRLYTPVSVMPELAQAGRSAAEEWPPDPAAPNGAPRVNATRWSGTCRKLLGDGRPAARRLSSGNARGTLLDAPGAGAALSGSRAARQPRLPVRHGAGSRPVE